MLDSWEKQTMPNMMLKFLLKGHGMWNSHVISNFHFEKCIAGDVLEFKIDFRYVSNATKGLNYNFPNVLFTCILLTAY
jgi:hypothetical protein